MDEKDMRKEMIKGVIEEIRGPRYGPEEVISYDPWDEYLIGTVIPTRWKRQSNSPSSENLNYSELDDGDEKTLALAGNSILNPSSQIKSFGMSFLVEEVSPKIDICITWSRYFKDDVSENAFSLKGDITERTEKSAFWKRKSFGKICSIMIDEEYNKGKYLNIEDSEDGLIRLFIKRSNYDNKSHLSIYLVNDLNPTPSRKKFRPETEDCIFQPSIRINLEKDPVGLRTNIKSTNVLDFLYNQRSVLAHGHLCSVIWKKIDYVKEFSEFEYLLWPDSILNNQDSKFSEFEEPTLRSEFAPLYPINLPDLDFNLEGLELSAEKLSNFTQQELYDNFQVLVNEYDNWIKENEIEAEELFKNKKISKEDYELITDENGLLSKQKDTLCRLKKGIDLIKNKRLVYLAFCFANRTIFLQDSWKKKLNDDDSTFNWRIFQIAFILLNLESICNDESIDKNILDLLWIPTGGGKTEAYLGIMAFTISLRRLKSYFGKSKEKTGAGVSVISRYTLRLLTVQQFRRTLKMITAAEYLRVYKCNNGAIGWRPDNCSFEGDWIYGSVRFSVGMWVGGAVTPLHLLSRPKYGNGAMDILKGDGKNTSGNPAQILKCPVCGSWLSVPKDGLTDNENKIHIVIKSNLDQDKIEDKLKIFEQLDYIKKPVIVSTKNNEKGFFTLSFIFNDSITQKKFKSNIINELKKSFGIASLGDYLVGYFKSRGRLGEGRTSETDYEIWCTNPDCDLNTFWNEGCPMPSENTFEFPDGNFERCIESPFIHGTKIPIPAYLIDEHVYHRCPSVIVSTADKIARLSFEPRAAAIFGNVDKYNKYYGYCRKDLFPNQESDICIRENVPITPFLAPDLIIQDELHLMNGPLGSLFGLYEVMVNALIEKQGGKPKYIASTATINNAEHQAKLLFSKKVSQFPPYGLDISNSFYVRENDDEIWSKSDSGRVYLGIYAPGMGAFTHQVRIYGRLLKIAQDFKDKDGIDINKFWTVVGYYNTIKELGSAIALYKDDLRARIKHISPENNARDIMPDGDSIELSSRIDSTDLPIILDTLERDGLRDYPKYNAIFTTSMFGTGVDISHLSTMVMNAQPKTTGDYIQATGRIGRDNGGLVVDLFRSGRPRDLNHYELFSSYHSRINREVEPISVSPFSQGCLSKGLGPSLVAFLRNASNLKKDWTIKSDARVILEENAMDDIDYYRNFLESYLEDMKFSDTKIKDILDIFDSEVQNWYDCAEISDILHYYEYVVVGDPKFNVVLGDPLHESDNNDTDRVYKNAPQSLREVEDTLEFKV